jgi:hypothetical protein
VFESCRDVYYSRKGAKAKRSRVRKGCWYEYLKVAGAYLHIAGCRLLFAGRRLLIAEKKKGYRLTSILLLYYPWMVS